MRQTRTNDGKTTKIVSLNIVSIADENKMKINPITVDENNRINFHPSKNLDISQLELLLKKNNTKHCKFIPKTSSNTSVLNTMSPVAELEFLAVQKNNIAIQRMVRFIQGEETLNHPVNLMSKFFQKLRNTSNAWRSKMAFYTENSLHSTLCRDHL